MGNVVEIVLLGHDLTRIILGGVVHGEDVGVAELGVGVKANLGVQAQHLAVGGLHEGVDLQLRAVLRDEEVVHGAELLGCYRGSLLFSFSIHCLNCHFSDRFNPGILRVV